MEHALEDRGDDNAPPVNWEEAFRQLQLQTLDLIYNFDNLSKTYEQAMIDCKASNDTLKEGIQEIGAISKNMQKLEEVICSIGIQNLEKDLNYHKKIEYGTGGLALLLAIGMAAGCVYIKRLRNMIRKREYQSESE